jgi:hypothetical protein
MTSEKLEPRLQREIGAVKEAGHGDRKIPVLIEHVEGVFAREGGDVADLEARVRHLQKGIVDQLSQFGAPDIQQSVLANLISASLEPRQIEVIADRDDVKVVRLNREEQVT